MFIFKKEKLLKLWNFIFFYYLECMPFKLKKLNWYVGSSEDKFDNIFTYAIQDQGSKSTASKMLEQKFQKALDEALVAYRKHKEKREQQEQNRSLKGNMVSSFWEDSMN